MKKKKICIIVVLCILVSMPIISFVTLSKVAKWRQDTTPLSVLDPEKTGGWDEVFSILESEKNPSLVDQKGLQLLFYACNRGQLKEAKKLIDMGVDPRKKGSGTTSLHCAVYSGDTNMAHLLLPYWEKGDLNTLDRWGETPLFFAVRCANPEMVELLLKSGSDPNIKHKDSGWSPLHKILMINLKLRNANEDHRFAIVKLLVQYGANINSNNEKGPEWESQHDSSPLGRRFSLPNHGTTPIEIARSNGFNEIVAYLQRDK